MRSEVFPSFYLSIPIRVSIVTILSNSEDQKLFLPSSLTHFLTFSLTYDP